MVAAQTNNQILTTASPKQTREEYKNLAVETREQGKLEKALNMFEQILEWDKENKNITGQMDTLGHTRITYTRLADEIQTENPKKAKELRYKALESVNSAIKLGKNKQKLKGECAIQKVHFASASSDLIQYLTSKTEKQKVLKKAYTTIKQAMKELPGSRAHQAWPSNAKAKIEYALGMTSKAIGTLTEAEKLLFDGYQEEFKRDDQAQLKFAVWLSGLHLTYAMIAAKENRPMLARHYATSVIMTLDPKGVLGERKKEAQRILDSIESSQ